MIRLLRDIVKARAQNILMLTADSVLLTTDFGADDMEGCAGL